MEVVVSSEEICSGFIRTFRVFLEVIQVYGILVVK